jgi:hypothetical protein
MFPAFKGTDVASKGKGCLQNVRQPHCGLQSTSRHEPCSLQVILAPVVDAIYCNGNSLSSVAHA